MAATLLGAVFPDAPFVRALMSQQGLDVAAELTAAYLGETAARPAAGGDVSELESEFALLDYEMDAVWGRVAGVSSNSRAREPGLLVQALRQLYSAVQAHLDELASAAADDISEVASPLLPPPPPSSFCLLPSPTSLALPRPPSSPLRLNNDSFLS